MNFMKEWKYKMFLMILKINIVLVSIELRFLLILLGYDVIILEKRHCVLVFLI